MADNPDNTRKRVLDGYAYYLAEQGLVEKDFALKVLEEALHDKISYIDYLLKNKILDESQIAKSTSEYFGLPLCDIQAFNPNLLSIEYLNMDFVKKHLALPVFKKNGLLYLAVIDPTIEILHDIKFLTGLDMRLLVVVSSKLNKVIDELLSSMILSELSEQKNNNAIDITVDVYKEKDEAEDISQFDTNSAPVVNYINKVLLNAISKNASDIHFEHYENSYRIRLRQHGILYPIPAPPLKIANFLLARIKVMSDLDITEHRIPQDGRFKLVISKKRAVDFRVSICPTLFGEKMVLRILDASTTQKIDTLGMSKDQIEHFYQAISRSQGMILVTGPTGSGKTVTLYSALHHLNTPEKNISTVEDPVEIPVVGINQVNVNLKTGLSFAVALRAFLRQDPNIIMVGEIRDLETAEIAVKAAQTGHLVLSTLHTNSAPETIMRLVNMGIAPYNLASSLNIIIAQRLVRVLCEHCKVEITIDKAALLKEGFAESEINTFKLYGPKGCELCTHGFKGRIGIFEVLPISNELSQLIMKGGNAIDINEKAKNEGMLTLRESGLTKVKEGITSLMELNRVFK